MIRTQIYFQQDQAEFLRKYAFQKGISVSEVIRNMVDSHIKKPKKMKSSYEALKMIEIQAKKLNVKGPKDLAKNLDKYLYR